MFLLVIYHSLRLNLPCPFQVFVVKYKKRIHDSTLYWRSEFVTQPGGLNIRQNFWEVISVVSVSYLPVRYLFIDSVQKSSVHRVGLKMNESLWFETQKRAHCLY